jgi:hypothetical protein
MYGFAVKAMEPHPRSNTIPTFDDLRASWAREANFVIE